MLWLEKTVVGLLGVDFDKQDKLVPLELS